MFWVEQRLLSEQGCVNNTSIEHESLDSAVKHVLGNAHNGEVWKVQLAINRNGKNNNNSNDGGV